MPASLGFSTVVTEQNAPFCDARGHLVVASVRALEAQLLVKASRVWSQPNGEQPVSNYPVSTLDTAPAGTVNL